MDSMGLSCDGGGSLKSNSTPSASAAAAAPKKMKKKKRSVMKRLHVDVDSPPETPPSKCNKQLQFGAEATSEVEVPATGSGSGIVSDSGSDTEILVESDSEPKTKTSMVWEKVYVPNFTYRKAAILWDENMRLLPVPSLPGSQQMVDMH